MRRALRGPLARHAVRLSARGGDEKTALGVLGEIHPEELAGRLQRFEDLLRSTAMQRALRSALPPTPPAPPRQWEHASRRRLSRPVLRMDDGLYFDL